jgi:hypothetical protein
MASPTHRQRQVVGLRKIERLRDIGCAGTAHDQRRMSIECAIENKA